MKLPATLTEARRRRGGMIAILERRNATLSTVRRVPYAERYRAFTGILETPPQHLQRITRDEQHRRASRR